MILQNKKLVTIITEAIIEKFLIEDLKSLGIRGYTISEVRGEGARGKRSADWDHAQNIRIEIVCGPETSEKIIFFLKEKYYEDYAIIVYRSDVEVTRPEKF